MSSPLDELSPLHLSLGSSGSLELDELEEGSLLPPPYPCIARRSPLFSGSRDEAQPSLSPTPSGVFDFQTLEAVCDVMHWLAAFSFMDWSSCSTCLFLFASF